MILILLAFSNLFMMGLFIWETIRRKESDFFFWSALFVVFALPALFDSIHNMESSQDFYLTKAFIFVFGTNCLFWLGKRIVPLQKPKKWLPFTAPKRLWKVLLLVQLSALGFLAVDIFLSSGLWLWQAFFKNWHEVAFYHTTFFHSIGLIVALAGSGACVLAWIQRNWLLLIISSLLVIYTTVLLGSRLYLIPAFTPIVFVEIIPRIRMRNFVIAALAGVILLFLIYEIQTLRWSDNRSIVRLFDPSVVSATYERLATGGMSGELGLRNGFYFFVKEMPKRLPFGNGQTYIRLLLFPLPSRFSGGLKPPDYTLQLYNYYYPTESNIGGTYHPLFYGDGYANFGFLGIITGFFWGSFFGILDRWLRKRSPWLQIILLSPVSCFAIFLARGAIYSSVVFLIYGSLIVLLVVVPMVRGVKLGLHNLRRRDSLRV